LEELKTNADALAGGLKGLDCLGFTENRCGIFGSGTPERKCRNILFPD
jgi:hypothetical protein